MKFKMRMLKVLIILAVISFIPNVSFADGEKNNNKSETNTDTIPLSRRFIHRLGIEGRPTYIIPTHSFFRGNNYFEKPLRNAYSAHLKYSFQFAPDTYADHIYGGVYQGIGLAYYNFGDRHELGNPFAFYLFQGARIAQLTPRLSINYEWNFGASAGWTPYDYDYNNYNKVIGSRINAYLDVNFHFKWMLSKLFDFTAGVDLSHFSNGNTKYPNGGLNTAGLRVGLVYNFNRKDNYLSQQMFQPVIPEFPRHISYDMVLFGSWRRKGVAFGDEQVAAPGAYTVVGFNFSPMYNFGYKFRAGVSLDGVYDGSANIYTEDYIVGTEQPFYKPPLKNQLALGLSGRIEYVMPYFTVNVGIGANVLHGGGDLKGLYQVLALKVELTRSSFLHIGYNLQNFHTPNYLMLGIGYRFHNKYPLFHR
ncbi:acyloxyacyl hydrolase [Parabacteroides bouchesdurhonensis]|uniref:acyloxyacyl hydrolase n=1 Tax=Parabacteroides bouchesdurhonensis TaxID=1936995 RepID=UPI000E4B133F|nr:acyloxyacyl hydrolase [Parabacteroides bouchesdurhonensis]RHJ90664.1 acyloxyacyl hydrolase [Bacteroides sp. AM07-16]